MFDLTCRTGFRRPESLGLFPPLPRGWEGGSYVWPQRTSNLVPKTTFDRGTETVLLSTVLESTVFCTLSVEERRRRADEEGGVVEERRRRAEGVEERRRREGEEGGIVEGGVVEGEGDGGFLKLLGN